MGGVLATIPGAIVLALALDHGSIGWLAWCAAVPFLRSLSGCGPGGAAVRCALFSVVLHGVLLRPFIDAGPLFYALTLAGVSAIYGTAGAFGALCFGNRSVLGVAGLFTLAESVKGALGLEWGTLGYTQWAVPPAFALADEIGARGISFLIWWANAALALWRPAPRSAWPAAALAVLALGCASWLGCATNPAPTPPTIDVAVVPGDFSSTLREESGWKSSIKRGLLRSHLDAPASLEPAADLVIWPEMATRAYVDRDYWFREAFRETRPPSSSTFLLGALGWSGDLDLPFNSAYAVDAAGAILARYDKRRLVPGFEYQPWPALWRRLHPRRVFHGFSPGAGADAGPLRIGDLRVGIGICYEENFPGGFRRQVRDGAELLVTLGSVSFGGGSTIARHMHRFALFRAAENRRWLVRSINGGLTEIIDPRGRVAASLPFPETLREVAELSSPSPVLRLPVSLHHGRSPFVAWGHGLAPAVGTAAFLGGVLRRSSGARRKEVSRASFAHRWSFHLHRT